MLIIFEIIIKVLGYSLIFLGLVQLIYMLIKDYYKLRKRDQRMRKAKKKLNNEVKKSVIASHVRELLYAALRNPSEQKLFSFYTLTLVLFLSTLLTIAFLTKEYLFALMISAFMALIPYTLMRFRLADVRLRSSYAFMQEFHKILAIYQSEKDIYVLVSKASKEIEDRSLKLAFARLLSSMDKVRTEGHFKLSVRRLAFTIGNTFSARFANILTKGYLDNVDVGNALIDLNKDLRKREKDIAQLKTKRTETIILGFLPIIVVPIMIIMAYRMTMMFRVDYVLAKTDSLILLVVAVVMAIISAMIAYLLRTPRVDY